MLANLAYCCAIATTGEARQAAVPGAPRIGEGQKSRPECDLSNLPGPGMVCFVPSHGASEVADGLLSSRTKSKWVVESWRGCRARGVAERVGGYLILKLPCPLIHGGSSNPITRSEVWP